MNIFSQASRRMGATHHPARSVRAPPFISYPNAEGGIIEDSGASAYGMAGTTGLAAGVDANDPSTWAATPRNAACPCGSGKKYKHCHGVVGQR
jgi:hypothetical protein